MIIISTNRGNFDFVTIDDALEFVSKVASEKDDIWVSKEEEYPCIAICVNGEYAVVNYFGNAEGEVWLSYNEDNRKEVTFSAGGDEWTPDISAVIRLEAMFSCIMEFCLPVTDPPVFNGKSCKYLNFSS